MTIKRTLKLASKSSFRSLSSSIRARRCHALRRRVHKFNNTTNHNHHQHQQQHLEQHQQQNNINQHYHEVYRPRRHSGDNLSSSADYFDHEDNEHQLHHKQNHKHNSHCSDLICNSSKHSNNNSNQTTGKREVKTMACAAAPAPTPAPEPEQWRAFVNNDKHLLDTMSDIEIQRQEIIYELIQTEKHHCSTLAIMKKVYADGLLNASAIPSYFGNAPHTDTTGGGKLSSHNHRGFVSSLPKRTSSHCVAIGESKGNHHCVSSNNKKHRHTTNLASHQKYLLAPIMPDCSGGVDCSEGSRLDNGNNECNGNNNNTKQNNDNNNESSNLTNKLMRNAVSKSTAHLIPPVDTERLFPCLDDLIEIHENLLFKLSERFNQSKWSSSSSSSSSDNHHRRQRGNNSSGVHNTSQNRNHQQHPNPSLGSCKSSSTPPFVGSPDCATTTTTASANQTANQTANGGSSDSNRSASIVNHHQSSCVVVVEEIGDILLEQFQINANYVRPRSPVRQFPANNNDNMCNKGHRQTSTRLRSLSMNDGDLDNHDDDEDHDDDDDDYDHDDDDDDDDDDDCGDHQITGVADQSLNRLSYERHHRHHHHHQLYDDEDEATTINSSSGRRQILAHDDLLPMSVSDDELPSCGDNQDNVSHGNHHANYHYNNQGRKKKHHHQDKILKVLKHEEKKKKPDIEEDETKRAPLLNGHKLRNVYSEFCSRHNDAIAYYKHLMRTDKRFKSFIERCQSEYPICKSKGIPECTLLVTQRLTKYPLLLDQLIRVTKANKRDEHNLRLALDEIKAIIASVNSELARIEQHNRLRELYLSIDPKSSTQFNGRKFTKRDLFAASNLLPQQQQQAQHLPPQSHRRWRNRKASMGNVPLPVRTLLFEDQQIKWWSASKRKLIDVTCLCLSDMIVFLRPESSSSSSLTSNSSSSGGCGAPPAAATAIMMTSNAMPTATSVSSSSSGASSLSSSSSSVLSVSSMSNAQNPKQVDFNGPETHHHNHHHHHHHLHQEPQQQQQQQQQSQQHQQQKQKQVKMQSSFSYTASSVGNGSGDAPVSSVRTPSFLNNLAITTSKTSVHQHQRIAGAIVSEQQNNASGNHKRYVFANIDSKPSVIALAKLLVREKAANDGTARIYLISSNPMQPEMYEIACTNQRHQKSLIASLKDAIERATRNQLELLSSCSSDDDDHDDDRGRIEGFNDDHHPQTITETNHQLKDDEDRDSCGIGDSSDCSSSGVKQADDDNNKQPATCGNVVAAPPVVAPSVHQAKASSKNLLDDTKLMVNQLMSRLSLRCDGLAGHRRSVISSSGEGANANRRSSVATAVVNRSRITRTNALKVSASKGGATDQQQQVSLKSGTAKGRNASGNASNGTTNGGRKLTSTSISSTSSGLSSASSSSCSGASSSSDGASLITTVLKNSGTESQPSQPFEKQQQQQQQQYRSTRHIRDSYRPEQKLEELRDLHRKLDDDKLVWQRQFSEQMKQLESERRAIEQARQQLEHERADLVDEREHLYRKLDLLKANGILLSPAHTIVRVPPPSLSSSSSMCAIPMSLVTIQPQQQQQHAGCQAISQHFRRV